MSIEMNRRAFLAGSAAAAGAWLAGGCSKFSNTRKIPGAILGASAAAGHRLRSGKIPPIEEEVAVDVAILGAGISGLSAARQLQRRGVSNFLVLELEAAAGGNAQSGRNAVSAYPWGAHYLPLPSEESVEIVELLEELGLVQGRDTAGDVIYDEYALCADPMERLYVDGSWQEGLVPRLDTSEAERREIDAFFQEMDRLRTARGADGRRAFAIPIDRSSQDERWRAWDRLTMAQFLDERGWKTRALRWYVDYCCRDDYGAGIESVSAWAGVHYFASRNGRGAHASSGAVLTWPEGNGWFVERFTRHLADRLRTRSLVWHVEPSDSGVVVDYLDLARDRSVRMRAKAAVCALPRFVAEHLIVRAPADQVARHCVYSPWMVANLTLASIPGAPLNGPAWDNVLRSGKSLGYVDATHQSLEAHAQKTVLTYYQPLDQAAPAAARETALAKTHAQWCEEILRELSPAHPRLADDLERIDVWLWGHAMIRPVPGFIWGEARRRMQEPCGRLVFAHSDMSGISIFEEAYTRGRHAADVVADQLHASL